MDANWQLIRASDVEIPADYPERCKRARDLADEAKKLDDPPRYHAKNRVKVREQRLSKPIYWQGRQWAVTRYGVECRNGCYSIAVDRIDESFYCATKSGRTGSWVQHMNGKIWVDLEDFAEALRIARRIRGMGI